MKNIVINQKNSDPLILKDENSDDIKTYTNEISKIMESSKICIIETTYNNVVVRPSEISSIIVTEMENEKSVNTIKKIFDESDILKD